MPPTVILNQDGFINPFVFSLAITVLLVVYRKGRFTRSGGTLYTAFAVVVGATNAFLFLFSPMSSEFSMPPTWTLVFYMTTEILYMILFWDRRTIVIGSLECFAVCTYAMTISETMRTYVFPLNLSTVYWGGDGYGDMFFQLGLYVSAIFFVASSALAIWEGKFLQKALGARIPKH